MHAHQHWRSRALTVVIGCLVALSAAACGAGADASSLSGALPGTPGCEDPELVEVPAEAAAPIQDMFADAVAAKGVDVSTVVTARTPAGAGGECAEMLTVTVSGAGPGGETTNVQLFAWWAGDALRDITCEAPACTGLVTGPFSVFQVDGDEESVVFYQPDEASAADLDAATPADGTGCSAEDLQLNQEGGDSVDEDGPRGVYVYENGEECAAAAAASGYGAWAVRSTGAGPSGEDLFQLASFEYWVELLPPR